MNLLTVSKLLDYLCDFLPSFERLSNDRQKTKTKAITPSISLRPITTGAKYTMKQSELLQIPCHLLKAQEKLCAPGAIGFVFASHWLKNKREILHQPLSVAVAIA